MPAEEIQRIYKDDERPIKGLNKDDLEYYQEFPEKTAKTINKPNKATNVAANK